MTGAAPATDRDALAALARRLPPGVRFGTSSWTFPGWEGIVYSRRYDARRAAAAMLGEYARFPLFGTAGIDSSFYRPLTARQLRDYAAVLPAGFRCASKVWRELTLPESPSFLDPDRFLREVYEPCAAHFDAHAGPFVFEFGALPARHALTPGRFAAALDAFFTRLPRDPRFAVEIRTARLLTPTYLAVLREHDVAHVFNAWSRMPPIGAQLDLPDALTGRQVVARLLLPPGGDYESLREAWAPFDRLRAPSEAVRRDVLRLLAVAVRAALPAYVLVNNKMEGSAPLTVVALAERAARELGPAPAQRPAG